MMRGYEYGPETDNDELGVLRALLNVISNYRNVLEIL